jgi:phosphoglycerate dehydrogenase-like enzyme
MPGSAPRPHFKVGLTADFYDPAGKPKFPDLGLSVLESCPGVQHYRLDRFEPQIAADQLRGAQGVVVLTPAVTVETLAEAENLLAIGRFGVGYDAVDVSACTAADVVAFITAGAVDHSVAEGTVAWMLALTHHLHTKDKLVRTGRWDDRAKYMGCELRERTFGAIGFGGIARATVTMLQSFNMKQPLAYDPFMDSATAERYGVRLVNLPELLSQADFVSVHCPLTPKTRGLIGPKELAMMKAGAYLINTARGGIVDEAALGEMLEQGKLAGAALDCFETEPLHQPHPLSHLENVIFAPHSIAWTHELFRDIGHAVCKGMVDLARGTQPQGVLNPEVFDRPSFQEKWARLRAAEKQVAYS